MDIVALTETKRKGNGTQIINDYIHVFIGVAKHERAKRGVSIMIHKRHQNKITDYEAVDENIIRVNLNINQRPVTVLGIYAISDDEPYARKDDFFAKMNEEITKIGNTREINGRVGRKTNNNVVGPHGELSQNDNGDTLIEICESQLLKITNGFYKHKDIHTYTWTQPTRNLKSVIDYVIVRQQTTLQVNDVRAYRGITCGSDHYMVKAKIIFPFRLQPRKQNNECYDNNETLEPKRYNLESLLTESTKHLYQKRLDEKLMNITPNNSVGEVYRNIVDSIQSAAEEAIGLKHRTKSKKVWWNGEIDVLIEKKKNAYKKWLCSKQQQDRDSYLEIKRITRQKVTAAKREIWDKKCQEINSYLGGRKCTESWKFISMVKAPEKFAPGLQLIPLNKWKEYYEKLLTEDRCEYTTRSPTEVNVEGENVIIDKT